MANDNPKYQAKCSMTDCVSTLLARDYKGPANFAKMNGVIERSNRTESCNMLGMMGTEGFEKVRRVYATDALVPAISTKEDRIKILTE